MSRLNDLFCIYADCYPFGLWDPGLVITNEMRALSELYLPMAEVSRAFRHFFSLALRFSSESGISLLAPRSCWLDFLREMRLTAPSVNPAALLRKLADDESYRIRFLFTLFLPRHHGGSFLRYPAQMDFIGNLLGRRTAVAANGIRCLDAACGTGEGAYDLAETLLNKGIPAALFRIDASTLEPLELFAAAHGCFPHDGERQDAFRDRMEKLITRGGAERITFFQGDVRCAPRPGDPKYDLILCNGLLGGPFLPGEFEVREAISSLAGRLKRGGVLLAADRFHGGWKKGLPPSVIMEVAQRCGLTSLPVAEGIAAEKKGP